VAAAASLTITSTRIEEMNHRKSRVLALSVLRQDHSGPPPSDAPVHPLRELRPIR
jgi:hypothetical protein